MEGLIILVVIGLIIAGVNLWINRGRKNKDD